MTLRISLGHIDEYDDTVATFARQLGLTSVQLHTPSNLSSDEGYWTLDDLRALVDRCTRDGLAIEGLENVPPAHFSKIQRGEHGRDEQLENYQKTIRNVGAAEIPFLGYNFITTYVWRTEMNSPGRGGAAVSSFDLARADEGNALASYKLTPRKNSPHRSRPT